MCDNCGCGMKAEQMASMPLFGLDSMNPLGENEEGAAHEASEPKGPMGEDID
jgi:hypothetical protein